MEPRKTAVIYARVSSTNDRQDTSRQITDLTKFAVAQDMEILNIYQEHISGAKKNEEREILTQCLSYCKENRVNYLLLSELSRLGRSTLQVLKSLELLHEAGVCVYIQNLGLYTLQPDGKINPVANILLVVMAEMGSVERMQIQQRLQSGREQYKLNNGKFGRPEGSSMSREDIEEKYPEVIKLLKSGYPIRKIAKLCDCGISTVQRIKKRLNI